MPQPSNLGELYDLQYQDYRADLNFYLRQAKKIGGRILEIGCGTGRIYLPLLKAGLDIWGLDFDPNMLATLKEKVKIQKLKPKVFQAEMRTFKLKTRFDLIIIPFRTFLHLLTPEDQKKALLNFREHLKPGGKLILNFFNPDCRRIALKHGQKEFASYVKHPLTKNRVRVSNLAYYSPHQQLFKATFLLEELGKHNLVVRTWSRTVKLRYIFRYEFEHLLALTGFKVLNLLGDFKGGKFDAKSRELIWIAQAT